MGLLKSFGVLSSADVMLSPVFNKIPGIPGVIPGAGVCVKGFVDDGFIGGVSHATTGTTLITRAGQWIASAIANPGTIQALAEDEGAIDLVPAGADNDGMQVQTQPAFTPSALRKIAFGARVKLTDVLAQDVFVGLASADTAIDITGSAPTNWAGFKIVDGAATIYATNDLAAETVTTTGVSAVDATYINLEAIITGLTKIEYFVNGTLYVTHTTVANIPNTIMAFSLATQNGEGTANHLGVKWAYCGMWNL